MPTLDIIYWTCLMLGAGYTLITLLTGSLGHAAGHFAHIGHGLHIPNVGHHIGGHGVGGQAGHVGHAGHGASHSHTGHSADGSHQSHTNQHGSSEPETAGVKFNIFQFLNIPAITGFMLGFGGVGVVSRHLGFPGRLSLICALSAGFGLWLLGIWIMTKVFGGAETTSHNTWDDLIGLYAEVTAAIDVGKPGLISFTVAGARQTSKAVSNEEEIIPRGASVRIRKIENHTAIVTPVNEKDGVKFQ